LNQFILIGKIDKPHFISVTKRKVKRNKLKFLGEYFKKEEEDSVTKNEFIARLAKRIDATELVIIEVDAIYHREERSKVTNGIYAFAEKYWEQHIWARGYFAITVGILSARCKNILRIKNCNHKQGNFSISEF
jgi:hypothetical protein